MSLPDWSYLGVLIGVSVRDSRKGAGIRTALRQIRSWGHRGKSAPPRPFRECVERSQNLGGAPGTVAGAVGELGDDAGIGEWVHVAACVARRYAQLALEQLRVDHGAFWQQVRDQLDGGVAAGGTIHMGEAAASPLRLKVARETNFSSPSRAAVLSLMQCPL